MAEGEFHESMNLAALWDLPVLFCCENNLYAMGTALDRSESETDLALKAAAYEMPAWPVDGMDVHAVARRRPPGGRRDPGRRRSRASSSCAPTGSAPTRCTTPSATATRPRSSSGRNATRSPPSPTRSAPAASPDGAVEAIETEVTAELDDAVAFARAGTLEPVDQLERFVVSREETDHDAPESQTTYREALREGIRDALRRDERVFVMGEDIGRYGGCFAVTLGLLEEFGPRPDPRHAAVGVGVRRCRHRRRPRGPAARSSRS